MSALEAEYFLRCQTASDINEHLPALRAYAEKCAIVVEFGVRTGNSTVALLAAQPTQLLLYDVAWHPECAPLYKLRGRTDLRFKKQNTKQADLKAGDMLHIDTDHTCDCLTTELFLHGNKITKFIAMHDTQIYGQTGSDGGPGLNQAISVFLAANPHWRIAEVRLNNNGMTILERRPALG